MIVQYACRLFIATLLIATVGACSKKLPPECATLVTQAMTQLKAHNVPGFLQHALPSQRAKYAKLARHKYFTTIIGFKLSKDLVTVDKANNKASVSVSTDHPKGYSGSLSVELVKQGGKWWIDIDASYKETQRITRFLLMKFR